MTMRSVRRLGAIACFALVPLSCVGVQDFGHRAKDADAGDTDAPLGDGSIDTTAVDTADVDAAPPSDLVRIPGGAVTVVWQNGATSSTRLTHDFDVDRHEVTVGQFRAWVDASMPSPCPGATCSLEPGGPYETSMRWYPHDDEHVHSTDYNAPCIQSAYAAFQMSAVGTYVRGDDRLPVNCVTFAQAAAVCHFRGMRLLTAVEWYWVGSGRGQQRPYPWGDKPPTACAQSIFMLDEQFCGFPQPVLTAPGDVSRDGVRDMGGSLAEWIWDPEVPTPHPKTLPDDYAGTPRTGDALIARGGDFAGRAEATRIVTERIMYGGYGALSDAQVGFRCARTKP